LKGRVTPAEFTESALTEEARLRLAREKVQVVPDPSLEAEREANRKSSPTAIVLQKSPSRVVLRLRDGRVFERRAEYPTGHPLKPMTREQMMDKFLSLATTVLTEGQARDLNRVCEELERLEDCSMLAGLLYQAADESV
jgi:2-methylcitrate dehydratase PrpD